MTYSGTVTNIINEVITQHDLHPNTHLKLSLIGIDFLREINNDTKPTIKTQRFDIPPNRVIPLPVDYIDWSKAAVQYKEGIKLLSYNYQMAQGVSTQNLPSASANINLYNFLQTGSSVQFQYLYGYGAGGSGRIQAFGNGDNLGEFSIDTVRRVIRLSPVIDLLNFYLEYLSDCMDHNENTVVHPYCIQAMKTYMIYHYLKFRKDPAYRSYEGDLLIETRAMRRRFLNLSPASIVNLVEQTWGAQD
jgi:hypothetical protein